MTEVHTVAGRPITRLALLALLASAALLLGGCLTITGVNAPSGPPSAAYTVTLTLELDDFFEEDGPFEEEDFRGMLAVRFPEEWQLLSASYSGAFSGNLTYSPAMADFFVSPSEDPDFPEEPSLPGFGLPGKPGYKWWAGYSSIHPSEAMGPIEVQLVFDQGDATGAFALDFISGLTDPLSPEDPEAEWSWWGFGAAFERPVFTGVPVQDIAPQVFFFEEPNLYAAVGRPVLGSGGVFDPDTADPSIVVDFGDGQTEGLKLEPLAFALGLWEWQWKHAWEAEGTYTVTVRGNESAGEGEATAVVHVGQSPFTDLPAEHEFFPAVVELWQDQIVAGYPDGTFRPYDPVLRAQLAKMAAIAFWYHDEELTNLDSPTFVDVPYTNDPYPFDYVEEAAEWGLVTGFADDTFRPWDKLTRIQLVRIIVRSHEFYLEDPPADYRMPFVDVPETDAKYVALAHYNGLVDGKSATRFEPYAGATRGHAAKILFNGLNIDPEFPDDADLEDLRSNSRMQRLGRAGVLQRQGWPSRGPRAWMSPAGER